MQAFHKGFLVLLGALALITLSCFFTVNQREQAIVTQLGKLVRVVRQPGLNFKIPLIQNVIFYDARILDFDIPDIEVTLGDQKRIVVDTFMCYRIKNPAQFFRTVRNEKQAEARLYTIITGTLRRVIGRTTLTELLSSKREAVMKEIWIAVKKASKNLGTEVIDLRIRKTDLPKENSQAIFNRMISERRQEAAGLRAQGNEQAQIIQANAERDRMIILADAKRKAMLLLSEGSQESFNIYQKSFGQHPKGALEFMKLQGYNTAFQDNIQAYIVTEKDLDSHFTPHK